MKDDLPSPDFLRKLISYDKATGKLFWKERDVDLFTDGKQSAAHNCAWWNGRFAGKEAFTADSHGYKQGGIFGRSYQAHRVIWAIIYDEWPEHIDHVNGIRSDNRLSNLRSVSQLENNRNAKRRSDNKSGVCGVCWHNASNKWAAQIRVSGKQKHLGCFNDFDEAVAARKAAEIEHGYHPNHGRDE